MRSSASLRLATFSIASGTHAIHSKNCASAAADKPSLVQAQNRKPPLRSTNDAMSLSKRPTRQTSVQSIFRRRNKLSAEGGGPEQGGRYRFHERAQSRSTCTPPPKLRKLVRRTTV